MKFAPSAAILLANLSLISCSSDNDSTSETLSQSEEGRLQGITDAHNAVRKNAAEMPGLKWDKKVAGQAQTYADRLAADGCDLRHSSGPYGENIFWAFGSVVTPKTVVDSWAGEEADYNYANNNCSGTCGHYTQIVWAGSLRLGCGFSVCDDSSEIWVCNYDPPGNYVGERPY